MRTPHLWRRQLLDGFWAVLVGFWPAKGCGGSPPRAPVPRARAPEGRAPRVMTFTYDGAARCLSVQGPLPGAAPQTAWNYDYL